MRRSADDLHRIADGDDARLEHAAVHAHQPAGLETGAAQDLGIDLGRVGVDGRDHAALAAWTNSSASPTWSRPPIQPCSAAPSTPSIRMLAQRRPVVTELRDGAVGDDEERRQVEGVPVLGLHQASALPGDVADRVRGAVRAPGLTADPRLAVPVEVAGRPTMRCASR